MKINLNDIIKSPYEVLTNEEYNKICKDYTPGTFYLIDRLNNNEFLFDEENIDFKSWFIKSINGEINKMEIDINFKNKLEMYGRDNLIEKVYEILFCDYNGKPFLASITNQEYSDYFRRIILYILFNNSNYNIKTDEKFNNLGKKVILPMLEKDTYSLKERLKQSIYAGLIGMDIKDERAATSPLSKNKIIALKTDESNEEKSLRVYQKLDEYVKNGSFEIDCYDIFEEKIINSKNKIKLCWFTDDYIPTMFEMKFIESILNINKNITLTIIPRCQNYANDATYEDVMDLLSCKEFTLLNKFFKERRFNVCDKGMDMGTFNAKRLSSVCAKIVIDSDYVIISGARSYEMGQGLNKDVFFTGVAICRSYSESVTGICKDDGGIMFLYQKAGDKSFLGFKKRHLYKKYCPTHKRYFPVCEKTTLDYIK